MVPTPKKHTKTKQIKKYGDVRGEGERLSVIEVEKRKKHGREKD